MTYNFRSISLQKFYFYLLILLPTCVLLMILLVAVISYFFEILGNTAGILLMMMSIIIPFTVLSNIEKKISQNTTVTLSSKMLTINKQTKYAIENIKKIKIKSGFRYYPAVIIYDQNDIKYVIRCAEKYNADFMEFTGHLYKLVKA